MLFYLNTVLTVFSAIDFGRHHAYYPAYGILNIILLITIIITETWAVIGPQRGT